MPDGGIVAACETPVPVQSVPGAPCNFELPAPPCDAVDRGDVEVIVDGTAIARDASHLNGWDYADVAEIQIYGPTCDAIAAGSATSVSIMFIISGPP